MESFSKLLPFTAQADLTMEDFESIDTKVEDRIVRVHSHPGAYDHTDEGSLGDEGSVETSTAICMDDDGGNSVVGADSVAPMDGENEDLMVGEEEDADATADAEGSADEVKKEE